MKPNIEIMRYFFLFLLFFIFNCEENPKTSSTKTGDNEISKIQSEANPRIIFFGDSLTAGYGLTDYEKSWPHLVVKKLANEGYHYELTNAGVSGDTTSGGLGRIDWVLSKKPDIFVLELGANDMLRGIPPEVTRANLKELVNKVKSTYPSTLILLIGMRATPNLGSEYRKKFDTIYIDIAKEENLTLVPFLLEKVAGVRKLNQKDGIHPTEEGHAIVAGYVYPFFKKLVKKIETKKQN